jgi:N-acetylmuramoyl-L-alanine amidase
MTKEKESQLVRNRDRAEIANRARAALMIRLHCDTGRGSGYAVYFPDRKGTRQGVRGPSGQLIQKSRKAANAMHAEMQARLAGALKSGGVRGDSATHIGARQGALTGSIYARIPIITIELVVLSNKQDAAFIKSEKGQNQMADAIAAGAERFLKS